jgi:hypothetical protein
LKILVSIDQADLVVSYLSSASKIYINKMMWTFDQTWHRLTSTFKVVQYLSGALALATFRHEKAQIMERFMMGM